MIDCFCTDQYLFPGGPPEGSPIIIISKKGLEAKLYRKQRQDGSLQAVTWEAAPQTKEETLERLKQSPDLYKSYRMLSDSWKEQFLDFCQGKKSLPLTYPQLTRTHTPPAA